MALFASSHHNHRLLSPHLYISISIYHIERAKRFTIGKTTGCPGQAHYGPRSHLADKKTLQMFPPDVSRERVLLIEGTAGFVRLMV